MLKFSITVVVAVSKGVGNLKTKRYVQICAFLLTLGFSGRCGAVDTCTTYVKLFKYPVTNAVLLSNIALSPDGKYFAESQSECTLRMLSLSNGDDSKFTGANDWINAIAFSPDGKHLLTGAGGPTYAVRLWNVATGTIEKTFTGNKKVIYCSVAYSPDGRNVAAADNDSAIYIWNVESGDLQQTIHAFAYCAHSLVFSHDSRFILASFGNLMREERTARIWDIASGQCVRTFSGHTGYVESADFSHDGKYIITASYDKTACLWDVTTGDNIRTFKGHTSAVSSARFSPDDRTVLTASSDATSRLWNVETGEQIRIFTIPGDKNCEIVSAEFLPDGNSILTGSK